MATLVALEQIALLPHASATADALAPLSADELRRASNSAALADLAAAECSLFPIAECAVAAGGFYRGRLPRPLTECMPLLAELILCGPALEPRFTSTESAK